VQNVDCVKVKNLLIIQKRKNMKKFSIEIIERGHELLNEDLFSVLGGSDDKCCSGNTGTVNHVVQCGCNSKAEG